MPPSARGIGAFVGLRQVLSSHSRRTPVALPSCARRTGRAPPARACDDGPGIPPALLPGVFERFTRADTSRSRTDARAGGPGLAIGAAITPAHGGRIEVHSVPGCTEFTSTSRRRTIRRECRRPGAGRRRSRRPASATRPWHRH
ncbi:ATP-binding protein [Streptomyces sp. NPDC006365]|uniref:ATP-binding protein n=1 Tax=Streptomyces sp. NPDC006365 TaxID=3364744 RepID=UPI0036C49131